LLRLLGGSLLRVLSFGGLPALMTISFIRYLHVNTDGGS
jgi:hypothetical protein